MHRAVAVQFENELLVVGALFHTEVFDVVLHVPDRREDAVDCDGAEGRVFALVFGCRHVSTSLANGHHQVQLHRVVHVADHVVRVHHLESRGEFAEVACCEGALTFHCDGHGFLVGVFNVTTETNLLEVQNDFGHIFHHTFDGREFVLHAFHTEGRDGKAFQRREENAAKRIAHSQTKSRLQGTEFELAVVVRRVEHDDLVRLLKIENGHSLLGLGFYFEYNSTINDSLMFSGI